MSRQSGKTEMTKVVMSSLYGKMARNESILEKNGWSIECWSPFEIRHEDGSFATGQAANMVVENLKSEHSTEEDVLDELVDTLFPDGHKLNGKEESKTHAVGLADMMYDLFVYVHGVNVYALDLVSRLAKNRCLTKAPKDIPQIEWPTGIVKEDEINC